MWIDDNRFEMKQQTTHTFILNTIMKYSLWWICEFENGIVMNNCKAQRQKQIQNLIIYIINWLKLSILSLLIIPLHNSVLSFSNYSIYLFIVNTKTIEQFISHLNSRQFHYLSLLVIVGYSHSIYTNQIETTNSIDIHFRS